MDTSRLRIVGVCLSTIHMEDRFFFIEALNRAAVQHGFRLMIFNACTDLYESNNPNNDGEATVFRLVPYDLLSAMIVFPCFLFSHEAVMETVRECKARGIPVISIDKEIAGCTCFTFSYADVFHRLCRHVLHDHGVRDVRMIAGTKGTVYSEQRVDAFRAALAAENIPFRNEMIGYGDFWEGPVQALMERWFEQEQQPFPQAIICANDTMAIAASMYLQRHGCRVPQDCIVTGFDGIVQAGYHVPHLTTCRQDYDAMGQGIVTALEQLLSGAPCPERHVIGFDMIRSQSCGCEPVSFENINDVTQEMFTRLHQCAFRQELMCTVQSSISKMTSITELPSVLIDKFTFHTNVFAINDDIFRAPDFGSGHHGAAAFSERVQILYHRYFWYQAEPCEIPVSQLIPRLELLLAHTEPILVCAVHFFDLTLGYCVFQPAISFDEYEKMHTFMSAINSALGIFRSRSQIETMNTQLLAANRELEHLYVHDPLTGLYNRRGFYKVFRQQLAEYRDSQPQVFLISADMDGLKAINDTYGHLEGDRAIGTLAQALLHCAGERDICARFGGDEFAVGGVLPAGDPGLYFAEFAQRFRGFLARYNDTAENPYRVEASIGFCTEPLRADFDLDAMMRTADDRMYADKQARRRASAPAQA